MHSAFMKLSAPDFQSQSDAMVELLEDPLFLCTLQDAKEAALAIKEVDIKS